MKHKLSLILVTCFTVAALACSLTENTTEGSNEATQAPTEPAEELITPPEPETALRVTDGMEMVQILAGEFPMGDDMSAFAPERPAHLVTLDTYWIDRYEVTNAQYRQCMEAERCPEPTLCGIMVSAASRTQCRRARPSSEQCVPPK